MNKLIAYIGLAFILLLVLMGTGVTYEVLARKQAAKDFPPPGNMIDIGGRRIHLDCRGAGSPTVIFESGWGTEGSLSWSSIHDEVAKNTRACAYSRAGIMWSDPKDAPQNGQAIAEDLHATLRQAGEQGPFILVGHSMGGPYMMIYTKHFGEEVAGLVFVDASHPEQYLRYNITRPLSWKQKMQEKFEVLQWKTAAMLRWVGVARFLATYEVREPNQVERDDQAIKAYASTSISAAIKEYEAFEQTLVEAGTFRQLGNRPTFVLTAMQPYSPENITDWEITEEQARQGQEMWKQMHDEMAAWSTQSQHQLVLDASHYIQRDRPDIVIAAINSVIEQVRRNAKERREHV